jgi:hypothetical protein
MNNKIDSLRRGERYVFNFTHKKNIHGIVCDVNLDRNYFVVYDMASKGYESIPQHRFLNANPLF